MKKYLKLEYILLVAITIYIISAVERVINKPEPDNTIHLEHMMDVMRVEMENNTLKNKIKLYEISIIQNNTRIDTLTNDELDSTWAAIFGG